MIMGLALGPVLEGLAKDQTLLEAEVLLFGATPPADLAAIGKPRATFVVDPACLRRRWNSAHGSKTFCKSCWTSNREATC